MKKVLIVGAGSTGAIVAELLSKARSGSSLSISIWEKSRGCGGRMSTTRFNSKSGGASLAADVGAQYISSPPFYQNAHSKLYNQLLTDSVLVPFSDQNIEGQHNLENGTRNFMCPDGVSSIAKYFINSSGAEVKLETRVSSLTKENNSILVESEDGTSQSFDCVVVTIPVPQILDLKGIDAMLDKSKKSRLERVEYSGRYAVALRLPDGFEPPVSWAAKYVTGNSCVRYISIDTKKRGVATPPHTLVIHTSVPFGVAHLEEDKDKVGEMILEQTRNVIDWLPGSSELEIKSHKWRYSQVKNSVMGQAGSMTISKSPRVVLCGDAFTHSNLDGCISSALSAVKSLDDLL